MLAIFDTNTICAIRSPARPLPRHRSVVTSRCFQEHLAVPVLPATRLHMDLLLRQPALNLQAILGVILSDVGATLQVWRKASRSGKIGERRTGRIEDCVFQLGRNGLRHATASTFSTAGGQCTQAARELWTRARLTAEFSSTIAVRVPKIDPSEAYLAGLLHEAGRIPALLNWISNEIDVNDVSAVGHAIAGDWELPRFVGPTLLLSSRLSQATSRLRRVVAIAWEMSNGICNGRPRPREPLLTTVDLEDDSQLGTMQTHPAPAARRLIRVQ